MNRIAVGIIVVLSLAMITVPVCGYSAADTEEADFTLNVYYSGTVYIGYMIDDSYMQFSDLVQGRESYDLGSGRYAKVTVYKGTSKFDIDYRKMTALLFADEKQVAGDATTDKFGKLTLTYELK